MVSKRARVRSESGLHLRPAGALCREAVKYKSKITIEYQGNTANAKSILSVLSICVRRGDVVTLMCEGPDEKKALAGILAVVDHGLQDDDGGD